MVVDEAGVVLPELGRVRSVGVDVGTVALLVEDEVLAGVDVEAVSDPGYEYLWGVWEKILFR